MRKWVSRSLKTPPGMISTLRSIALVTKSDAVVPRGAAGYAYYAAAGRPGWNRLLSRSNTMSRLRR
jgi:hypothetical protein